MEYASQENSAQVQNQLFLSAARISEVSNEDMGLKGRNHAELYAQMATLFCGSDAWKLDCHSLPNATEYLTHCREYRERGENLVYALMISLAEELYNHSEFTFIAPLFKEFHDHTHAINSGSKRENMRFVLEHVGGVESGHFANMVKGLLHYCKAKEIEVDIDLLGRVNREFLEGVSSKYQFLLEGMKRSVKQDVEMQTMGIISKQY